MASLIARYGQGRNKKKVQYYVQYYIAGKPYRKSLGTDSLK